MCLFTMKSPGAGCAWPCRPSPAFAWNAMCLYLMKSWCWLSLALSAVSCLRLHRNNRWQAIIPCLGNKSISRCRIISINNLFSSINHIPIVMSLGLLYVCFFTLYFLKTEILRSTIFNKTYYETENVALCRSYSLFLKLNTSLFSRVFSASTF